MDFESRINAALGQIVRSFNYLEMNLGLCLRFLENPDDISASHAYLNRAGMSQTIKRLKKLLDECEHIPDTLEYDEWMERAEEIRSLRNYYVHATWEYFSLHKEAPLRFWIPPWRKESIEGRAQGTMRIEDLEADANRVETAFNDFMAIRKKYRV